MALRSMVKISAWVIIGFAAAAASIGCATFKSLPSPKLNRISALERRTADL